MQGSNLHGKKMKIEIGWEQCVGVGCFDREEQQNWMRKKVLRLLFSHNFVDFEQT